MCLFECLANLPQQVDGSRGGQWAVLCDELFEREPPQELHDVVKGAVAGSAVIVNVDGVRVRKLGRGADLAFETSECNRVGVLAGANSFESAGPLEQGVFREVDLAHSSAANQAFEAVLAESPRPSRFLPEPID